MLPQSELCRSGFFAQKRQFANCLISKLSSVRFLCLSSANKQFLSGRRSTLTCWSSLSLAGSTVRMFWFVPAASEQRWDQ
jgi:hypothetical protein